MNKTTNDDRSTVQRVLEGDFDAFETLVEKYQARIYRHLRKMVKDDPCAEDLLQETFLNAYRGLKGFSGESSFSTWLFRIATNNALMFLRKRRPESVQYDDEIGDHANPFYMTASPEFVSTPLEILLSEEGRRQLEEAIEGLPVLYRSVLVLKDVEGFSLEEVSQIMDTSIPAVKSRLHRARNAVRESLVEYYLDRDMSG
jgi:RNA polymerase sigma-70 factor (ECF subfamily)